MEDRGVREEGVEDLRTQLLTHEPMRLTLPQSHTETSPTSIETQSIPEVAPIKVMAEKACKTDPMPCETMLYRIDTN